MTSRGRLQSLLARWMRRPTPPSAVQVAAPAPPSAEQAAPARATAVARRRAADGEAEAIGESGASAEAEASGQSGAGILDGATASRVRGATEDGPADDSVPVWLPAAENPWGVPVLDISAVTLNLLSTSPDAEHANNVGSYHGSDGREFAGMAPVSKRTVEVALRYRVDRVLADGVLYCPATMEDKWAIFRRDERLLFIRSWTRQVVAVAQTRLETGWLFVTSVEGTLGNEDASPTFIQRQLDYLIRTHALGVPWPVPLVAGQEQDANAAALHCFAQFGRQAHFATADEIRIEPPMRPLRSDSALHIAAARADLTTLREQLERGVPVDLLASDGLAPLHWALASRSLPVVELLLDHGSPVDVRSEHGTTPLMLAAQRGAADMVRLLLMRGAQPDAQDDRGFMALHAAAHEGQLEVAQLLIACDCDLDAEARGETPRTLATRRHHPAVVHLIDRALAQRGGAPLG